MSQTTAHLALPLMMPSQAQKHVTHNEALQILDLMVQPSVLDRDRSIPPEAPLEGARHLVASGASGLWAGQEGCIAGFLGGAWSFLAPQKGWRVYEAAGDQWLAYDGALWRPESAQDLACATLGVGAASDNTNRLAVATPAVLLSHAGAGVQLKVNKAAAADTASLLFQSDWTGHAEMGLAGHNDFTLKVSADGTSFTEALRVSATTARVSGAAVTQNRRDTTLGRILTVGDFGIGAPDAPAQTDWDSGLDHVNGFFAGDPGASGTAPPLSGAQRPGLVLARQAGGQRRSLIVQNLGVDELACRAYEDGAPLAGWRKLYGQMNIVGPVAQTAGAPTGAVLERGSSAEGRFYRRADGRLECRHVITASAAAASSWTFPAAFATPPVLSLTAVAVGVAVAQLEVVPTTSGIVFSVRDPAGVRLAVPCHLLAVGDWF